MKRENIVFIVGLISILIGSIISVSAVTYLYNSSEVSYDNTNSGISATNVQGAINELYDTAQDYSSMNTRVSALESRYGSGTHYTSNDWIYITDTNSTEDRGLMIKDNSSQNRASFRYSSSTGRTTLESRGSDGVFGSGTLDLRGNPVMINGNYAMFNTYASSTDDLNTIFDNQPDRTVYLIGAQGEANQAISNGTALHFVISYRAASGWGAQYEFNSGRIFYRSKGNGTWGAWTQKL